MRIVACLQLDSVIVHDELDDIIGGISYDAREHDLCFIYMIEAAYEGNSERSPYLNHQYYTLSQRMKSSVNGWTSRRNL